MINRFGEKTWKSVFSLLSLAGLGLLIWGYMGTRAGPAAADFVWYPPEWSRHATMLLVLLGMIALAASFHKGYLKTVLRNPMSIGVGLWAAGHLLSNGKFASVLLFGAFLAQSIIDIVINEWHGNRPSHQPRALHDVIAIAGGLLLFAFFALVFHPYVLNIPVFQ
jgi:uncharacterized membrane protein